MEINRLQLQSSSPQTPGDLGFKLLGASRLLQGRVARIWLRKKRGGARHIWHRYLKPRATSETWEVRLHEKRGTGAMTLIEFSPGELSRLGEEYAFPQSPDGLDKLRKVAVDDPLFNLVRDWVIEVTAPAQTTAPPDAVEEEGEKS